MKCISAAFKAALKQDFGEEHTLRRRPFPVLSFSKTQKSAHLVNKPIVGAESPPRLCLTHGGEGQRGRKRWIGMTEGESGRQKLRRKDER